MSATPAVTLTPLWWCDLNPSPTVANEGKPALARNVFDIAAAICFLFAAFILPYKPQPALGSLALCCVLSLFGAHWRSTFKQIAASPIAWMALALYAIILIAYSHSDAPFEEKIKFISAYRELLFIPFLLCFLDGFRRLKQDAALVFFVLAMIIVGISTFNFIFYFLHLKPLFNVAPNDNYIFHSRIVQNVMSSVTVLFMLLQAKNRLFLSPRWFLFVALALLGIANILFMLQGRTGHMTLIACCFIFAFCSFNKKIKIGALAAIALALLVLLNTDNPFNKAVKRTATEVSVYEQKGEATSAGARIEFWKYSLKHINDNPWVGHGAGAYRHQYAQHIQKNSQPGFILGTHHPHNEFLFLWHDAGLLALLLYIGLIATLLWQAHKTDNTNTKTMRFGIAASLVIYSMVDVPLFNSAEALFFVLMVACFFEINMKHTQKAA